MFLHGSCAVIENQRCDLEVTSISFEDRCRDDMAKGMSTNARAARYILCSQSMHARAQL